MRAFRDGVAGGLLAASLAACASAPQAVTPAQTADKLTRAVYATDFEGTAAFFDAATKGTLTRGDLGEMSDKMHALGDYQALTERNAAPDTGKYEYVAAFSGGKLLVQMRVDADGKVAAYRIVPGGAGGATATASAKN